MQVSMHWIGHDCLTNIWVSKWWFFARCHWTIQVFFWLHWFLHRHAYFAPSLTLYFLIYCSFPLSRYSFSAIKVSSKSWLSQRCFSDITNGNYCLSPSSYILISLSFNLCVCACVSCGNISFDTTCFVICRFLE